MSGSVNPRVTGSNDNEDASAIVLRGVAESPVVARGKRVKLWHLPARYHCAVIGTCLTLDELRKLCRKARVKLEKPLDDYELHTAFVGIVGDPCHVSRLVQKHLDRKFRSVIGRFSRARDGDGMETLWRQAVESGEVAGAFWALLTNSRVPDELLARVYGEIHMLSHLAGASVRVDMREFDRQREECRRLAGQLAKEQQDGKRHRNQFVQVRGELDWYREAYRKLTLQAQAMRGRLECKARNSETDVLRRHVEHLRGEMEAESRRRRHAEESARKWKEASLRLDERRQDLDTRLVESTMECQALEKALAMLLAEDCRACPESVEGCRAHPGLCGRCVLFVGGRNAQCAHFRKLVEQQNGEFLHHDGGREDSRQQLGAMLSRVDVVMCPLDCVSHDAMHRVRSHCDRYRKPLVFLPRASLSAFTRGLESLVN